MQKIDEDLLRAAVDTYKLEKMVDPDANALEAALSAGFLEQERKIIERIATAAEELAQHIMAEEEPSSEGAAALEIFAYDLRQQIPLVNKHYEPNDGDIVEITLSGEVSVYEDECPNCGGDFGTTFGVLDRATGVEYHFDPKESENLRVRLISGGIEEFI